MLTLIQLIKRMMSLEYSEAEILGHLEMVANGDEMIEHLFDALDLEMPTSEVQRIRLTQVLPEYERAVKVAMIMWGGQ